MEVGTITPDGQFDIDDVDESDQALVKTDVGGVVSTRWYYRAPDGNIIIHERSETHSDIAKKGTFLRIGVPGYATSCLSKTYDQKVVGKLLTDIDWNDTSGLITKIVEEGGGVYEAVLVPIKLL